MARRIALVGLAAALVIPVAPASADTGTLSGKLADGKLPAASAGRAYVRAISVPEGRVVGGTAVPRSGAWTLKLPPGAYVLTASVVTRTSALDAMAPVQWVREGRTTRTRVSLERKRAPAVKPHRRKAARAAATSAAIGIGPFSGTGPNAQLGKGLADMLITEMSDAQSGDCKAQVVEVEHRADVLREIALSNSNLAAPGSSLRSDRLIDPVVSVRGTVPTLLIFPTSGGTQSVAGGLGSVAAGWTNTGTVTVTRLPRGVL